MATLKYSRQRESIKEFLRSRTDHPTADVVYENMKLIYPNISLGTVYPTYLCWLIWERSRSFPLSPERITLTVEPRGTAISCVPDVSGSLIWRMRRSTILWNLQVRTLAERLQITAQDSSDYAKTV